MKLECVQCNGVGCVLSCEATAGLDALYYEKFSSTRFFFLFFPSTCTASRINTTASAE